MTAPTPTAATTPEDLMASASRKRAEAAIYGAEGRRATPTPLAAETRALLESERRLLNAAVAVAIVGRTVMGRTPWGLLSDPERRDVLRGAADSLDFASDEIGRAKRAVEMARDWT